MPSGDYSNVGGGALKLKGGKVQKKKKKKDKSGLEKSLASEDGAIVEKSSVPPEDRDKDGSADEKDDHRPAPQKTESERRYEETRKKRLLQMAGSSRDKPEMLKTHKERVEDLNTYLSKLSEHHDMPKIGPG